MEVIFSLFFYIFLTIIKSDIWNIKFLYKPSSTLLLLFEELQSSIHTKQSQSFKTIPILPKKKVGRGQKKCTFYDYVFSPEDLTTTLNIHTGDWSKTFSFISILTTFCQRSFHLTWQCTSRGVEPQGLRPLKVLMKRAKPPSICACWIGENSHLSTHQTPVKHILIQILPSF